MFDNIYEWLRVSFSKLVKNPICRKHEAYISGVLQRAALEKVLEHERISVIEFGVAGGQSVLPQHKNSAWADKLYSLHVFDHTLCNHPDSLRMDTRTHLTGKRETGVVAVLDSKISTGDSRMPEAVSEDV